MEEEYTPTTEEQEVEYENDPLADQEDLQDQEQDTTQSTTEEPPVENEPSDPTQATTESPVDYYPIYSDQLELTNHLLSGIIFFIGILFGVLLCKIVWDRFKV